VLKIQYMPIAFIQSQPWRHIFVYKRLKFKERLYTAGTLLQVIKVGKEHQVKLSNYEHRRTAVCDASLYL